MTDDDPLVAAVAARHGFSHGAVLAMAEGLRRGGGRMAQFSHPELGGMGQWSAGGLLQIGAMFDHALKARVAAAIAELAAPPPVGGAPAARRGGEVDEAAGPWPPEFGRVSASGAQGGMRYAYFAEARRLAVVRDGKVTLYDTGPHRITGASQAEGGGQRVAFASDRGAVDLDRLRVVGSEPLTRS